MKRQVTKIADHKWRGDMRPDTALPATERYLGMPLDVFIRLVNEGFTRLDEMRAAWQTAVEKVQ